jgi:ribosomal protein L7/L12
MVEGGNHLEGVDKMALCFVIGPIGKDGSPERKHSDLLLNAVIKQVLQKTEFDYIVKRADEDADPGMIGDRVISDIINAELVVADLTDLNPNAFYELGIRHSTEKPAIHVARAGTALPFDNVAHRTIFVDLTDWHSIEQARERLASSARTIRTPDYKVSNPITQANASFKMRQSEDPRDQVIAQIQERMAALETAFPMRSMAIEYDAQKDVREIATALEKNEIKRAISLYRGLTGADLVQSKSFIEAVKNGRKIDSIKIHRTVTSDSLREAKDFVDILAGER